MSLLLAILHFVNLNNDIYSYASLLSKSIGVLPAFMAYSSFSDSEGLPYTAMVVAGLLFIILNVFWKLVHEDEVNKKIVAIERENHT